ncbi:MAG: putative LPS assembly protein LptD, partial [Bacteroidota bacterium]
PDFGAARYGFYKTAQVDRQGNTRIYSPYAGFGYGVAGAGGSASLNWSIDNNLEFKTRTQGDSGEVLQRRKLFDSFRFGGAYNFNADSLKMSSIQWGGRTQFGDRFSLLFSGVWDVYQRGEDRRLINRWLASEQWWKPVALSQANFTLSGGFGG